MNLTQVKFARVPSIPYQFIDERALILTPDTQMAHELNESATLIFKILETPMNIEEICLELAKTYQPDQIIGNLNLIEKSIIEMIDKKIITRQ